MSIVAILAIIALILAVCSLIPPIAHPTLMAVSVILLAAAVLVGALGVVH